MLNKKIKKNYHDHVLTFSCSWNKDALHGTQFGVDRADADLVFGFTCLSDCVVGFLI